MRSCGSFLFLALGATCFFACSTSNHDLLAERDASLSNDSSGDSAGLDSSGADSGTNDAQDADANQDASPDGLSPDGPPALTVVHGIVDASAMRLCFQQQINGVFSPLAFNPIPQDPQGLPYSHAMAGPDWTGVDLEKVALRPVVLTGDLTKIDGKSCEVLSDLPAGVTASEMPVLPAGTLSHKRSLLMAFAGCVGGSGHGQADSISQAVCGDSYSPLNPTLSMLLTTIDRAALSDRIGLQVFAGSLSSLPLTVEHISEGFLTVIAEKVPVGSLKPRPASSDLSLSTIGAVSATSMIRITDPSTAWVVEVPLSDALTRGGFVLGDLADGQNFTVFLVGPRAGMASGGWWSGFAAGMVKNSP